MYKSNLKCFKISLIQSTLAAIPSYYMQCFPIHKSIINEVNSIASNFLWQSSPSKKGIHLLAWEKVCQPKGCGGLGIRNLGYKNRLLITKLCWRLASFLLNLASQIISKKYIFSRPYPFSFRKGSYIWRGLKDSWGGFTDSCRWVVGDGSQINFWEDKWAGMVPIRTHITGPLSSTDHNLTVADCIVDGKWDLNRLGFSLPSMVLKNILCIPITISNQSDMAVSKYVIKDKFMLKKAYNDLFSWNENMSKDMDLVWNSNTLPKVKLFIWQIWRDLLPTKSLLSHRGMNITPYCPFCPQNVESPSHILKECVRAKEVWALISNLDTKNYLYRN